MNKAPKKQKYEFDGSNLSQLFGVPKNQVAEILDVSPQQVSNITKNNKRPSADVLVNILMQFNIPISAVAKKK